MGYTTKLINSQRAIIDIINGHRKSRSEPGIYTRDASVNRSWRHVCFHPKQNTQSGRRRDYSRRPPTPPHVRFRIRRFPSSLLISPQRQLSYKHPVLPYGFRPLLQTLGPLNEASAKDNLNFGTIALTDSALRPKGTTMTSADFCISIPSSLDDGSSWQIHRPPRVMHTCLHAYARRIYDHAFRAAIGL